MMNAIKRTYIFHLQWSQIFIQTVKKKNGRLNKLESYKVIFLVSVLSLIFEELPRNRRHFILERNMSTFQTGGVKGKGVVDNLFVLRGLIDHSNYFAKLFMTLKNDLLAYGLKIASMLCEEMEYKIIRFILFTSRIERHISQ